ncbi:MAG: VWA domain-containing protein [Gammaproteobacteria bacterium]|nr:VWA domain-containing protein [Gammaproteobacteria bacterium]
MNELASASFRFAQPAFAHGLWLVSAAAIGLIWLDGRRSSALNLFLDGVMQTRLVERPARAKRRLRIGLLALAGIAMVLALMRPQWGVTTVTSSRAGAEIMIALDVSRSMLAEDVIPNRLARAKSELRDLLTLLDGDQVGLIAFAGRASVLSPLTPDFNFIRVALKDATANSVGRGGTRLEEPIRKALAGFGTTGRAARSIILITDGEDHDSFPREAAKAAAQRGVRILAIGFGDEAGSRIVVTEAKTGARTPLTDASGQAVISRLDGDLLRDLASTTEGAYIPAGTGLLDLEAIFERHIAPLTRGDLDSRERIVRRDIYRWPAAAAIVLLMLALTLNRRGGFSNSAQRTTAAGATVALLMALLAALLAAVAPQPLHAQQTTAPPAPPTTAPSTTPASTTPPSTTPAPPPADTTATEEAPAQEALPATPRTAYNTGLEALGAGQLNRAAELLEHARSSAREDAEVRYSATFNLGWVAIRKADDRLASAPQEALDQLHEAARWFSEATRLRPEDPQPRQNLELTLRRALQLADQLAAEDDTTIEQLLDALIVRQRAFVAALAGISASAEANATHAAKALRDRYRQAALQAIGLVGETTQLRDQAQARAKVLEQEAEADGEKALRKAVLDAAIPHLQSAAQRMMQSRARLRRAQGSGAFRRAAKALAALQRSRDQLRSPIERLDAVLGNVDELRQMTGLALRAADGTPAWLSSDYIHDLHATTQERANELALQFESIEALPEQQADASSPPKPEDERTRALIESIRAASTHVSAAAQAIEKAKTHAHGGAMEQAAEAQEAALKSLGMARELFLDLRRLVELVYTAQNRLPALLAPEHPAPADTRQAILTATHGQNIERMIRVGALISEAMTATSTEQNPAPPPPPKEHFERGYEQWVKTQQAMHRATAPLAAFDGTEPARTAAEPALAQSIAALKALRRHFFNLIEHLQETAGDQQRINDDTTTLAGLLTSLSEDEVKARAGPLGIRQSGNAERAAAIAQALSEQAKAHPVPQPQGGQAPGSQTQGGQAPQPTGPSAEQLAQAGELVKNAGDLMRSSGQALVAQTLASAMQTVREEQDEALAKLAEAIVLLQPPRQQNEQQQQAQDPPQEQSAEREDQQDEQQNNADEAMARMLQGVRDREAQRRETRNQQRGRGEVVEKDW